MSDKPVFNEESAQRAQDAYNNFYQPHLTPFQRALRAFNAKAAAYEEEMMRLHYGGKDIKGNEGWKRLRRD